MVIEVTCNDSIVEVFCGKFYISTTLLLQMTSMKGFSYFVATSAPFPVASFTKLTVNISSNKCLSCLQAGCVNAWSPGQ